MAQLLISVRSADEARAALDAGADWIDVKEPARGPLGRADANVIAEVLDLVAGRAPVSAALGELLELDPRLSPPDERLPAGLTLVKVGLAGCALEVGWPARWADFVSRQAAGVAAAVYADWRAARAPSPARVLDQAGRLGCCAVLVDTFDKTAGELPRIWEVNALGRFVRAARQRGLLVALAGSLSPAAIGRVLPLGPDLVAVRGAACRGGRGGVIDPAKVRRLARLVSGARCRQSRQTA